MKIRIVGGQPLVSVALQHDGKYVEFKNVLLDTGSGGSLFPTDKLNQASIQPKPGAIIRQIIGIGGSESVIEMPIDRIAVGDMVLENFVIESGKSYEEFGFEAILAFDFYKQLEGWT
ncbi:MAG: aspartyl protease family protein [Chloroflexi bacterium]|nr:aspartyl protease family protein [Chloroflexota bacterium]